MSKILKKITSIEPDEIDVLEAINALPEKTKDKAPIVSSIEEIDVDDDPVPEFITRQTSDPAPIITEEIKAETDLKPSKPLSLKPLPDEAVQALIDEPASDFKKEEAFIRPEKVNTDNPLEQTTILNTPTGSIHGLETVASNKWMLWAGLISAFIWAAASFSYFYGFFSLGQKWTDLNPMHIFGIVMAVLLPAILLAILFYALKQLSKLSKQSHNLARAAYELSQPSESFMSKTESISTFIKSEVDGVDARIDQALARMSTLEDVLKERTESLESATGHTAQTTDEIASRLTTQRLALESIAGTFDNRMALLSSSLTEHTTKLDGSTQVAEQKIQEARVSVEGAAERINSASEVVRGNSIDAATALTKSHEEIENLANMIRERSAELDEVYRKHAQDLTGMIAQLRDEQQNLSISLDERLSKMRDMSLAAKVSAESLTDASEAGRQTVEALASATRLTDTAVKQRFTEMEDMVKFSSEKAENISDQAARRVQDSLVQTRKEIARIEDDMLAMQSRLSSAKPQQPQKSSDQLSLDTPKQPQKKSRGRLKLRALNEDEPATSPKRENRALALDDKPSDDLEIPDIRSSLLTQPVSFAGEKLGLEIDPESDIIVERSALTVEPDSPVDTEVLTAMPPLNEELIEPVQLEKNQKKGRSGWRWRDMLNGLEKPDAVQPKTLQSSSSVRRDISNERMIASLSALGLAPAAIVDDGCIIEATNTRRSKGAHAMSQTVSQRIGGPIRHLQRSMEDNAGLKSDARAYAAQFSARIAAIETDREAIRTRLESDAGRAFLLCDAALNG